MFLHRQSSYTKKQPNMYNYHAHYIPVIVASITFIVTTSPTTQGLRTPCIGSICSTSSRARTVISFPSIKIRTSTISNVAIVSTFRAVIFLLLLTSTVTKSSNISHKLSKWSKSKLYLHYFHSLDSLYISEVSM